MDTGAEPRLKQSCCQRGRGGGVSSSAPSEVMARKATGAGQPVTQGRLERPLLRSLSGVRVVQSSAQETINTDLLNGGKEGGLSGGNEPRTQSIRAP